MGPACVISPPPWWYGVGGKGRKSNGLAQIKRGCKLWKDSCLIFKGQFVLVQAYERQVNTLSATHLCTLPR